MPRAAVLMCAGVESDKVAKKLITAIGQDASLRIKNPFEISAELVDVVDVAGQITLPEARHAANRKAFRVNAGLVIGVRENPGDRKDCRDGERHRRFVRQTPKGRKK